MSDPNTVKIGDNVVYHDPGGRPHNAVVNAVWSPPMVNLVFVSSDDSRTDAYGRQIERATSCYHKSQTKVHGSYWRYPEEEPNPVVKPSQT